HSLQALQSLCPSSLRFGIAQVPTFYTRTTQTHAALTPRPGLLGVGPSGSRRRVSVGDQCAPFSASSEFPPPPVSSTPLFSSLCGSVRTNSASCQILVL